MPIIKNILRKGTARLQNLKDFDVFVDESGVVGSLAIRIGLMNVSNLPQGNFLAIDEGWGTMDSDNLNSVAQLFQYLKSQFQFTFVVSHIETMRDFVDTLLEIKKVDGSSSVRFSR